MDQKIEQDRKSVDKVFEELSSHDIKLDKELVQQKVKYSSVCVSEFKFENWKETVNEALTNIVRDLNKFRHSLAQSKEETTNYQGQLTSRLTNLKLTVEDLKEKTWKLDVNTRSNLVFYGIKEDGNCCNAEFSVKEVRGEGTTKKGGGSFLGLQRL